MLVESKLSNEAAIKEFTSENDEFRKHKKEFKGILSQDSKTNLN